MALPQDAAALATPPSAGLPWSTRAVQLDLARQMETTDFLRRYLDFIAAHKFNTLVLYLEGRVRTAGFPFRSAAESYTLDDMALVVSHAQSLDIDVVPALGTLGHSEQFVGCPELAHLSEERDGGTRFGGNHASTFCNSLPATYQFIGGYLAELAQVFTGGNIHVGCDEAWNMGYCALCRRRWEVHGLHSILGDHLQQMHTLCSELGKRMWIWDDMFNLFPQLLPALPRDIVMCHWNYETVVDPAGVFAQFGNRDRHDWLAEFRRLGFDALICPWLVSSLNVETFTDYGRRHDVMGGLLTNWEMSAEYHPLYAPVVAFTGSLWNSTGFDTEAAWSDGIGALLPSISPTATTIIETCTARMAKRPWGSIKSYLRGPLTEAERLREAQCRIAYQTLSALGVTELTTPEQLAIRDDFVRSTRLELLFWELRSLLPNIYDPRQPAADRPLLKLRVSAVRDEIEALLPLAKALYDERRPSMHLVDQLSQQLHELASALQPAWERLERETQATDWMLTLRLLLPDPTGSPLLTVKVDGELVDSGRFKPSDLTGGGYFTVQLPFTCAATPQTAEIEMSGYGSLNVCHLRLDNHTQTLLPQAVEAADGAVQQVEAVLRDDSRAAMIGLADVAAAVLQPARAEIPARIKVALAAKHRATANVVTV